MSNENSRLRGVLTGMVGFSVGGILGNLTSYLIAISGVVGWLLNIIPDSQPLVRLFSAIISAFLVIALGGAVNGVINGLTLNRIDSGAEQRQYIFGSGYAFTVGQAIFVIPTLLIISFISLYNNAPQQPSAYLIFFGLLGLIYGLLLGLILSLITVRLRYSWRVLLASILGFAVGGGLIGFAFYNINLFSGGTSDTLRALTRLVILTLAIYLPSGAALGLAYHWIANKRTTVDEERMNPSRWQIITVSVISFLVLASIAVVVHQAERFLTVRPGSTATQLSGETIGVRWSAPHSLASEFEDSSPIQQTIGVNEDGLLAIGWSQGTESGSDIYYVYKNTQEADTLDWSMQVNVSNSPSQMSTQPQVVLDDEGVAHFVWQEDFDSNTNGYQILYSRCDANQCSTPTVISDLSNLSCAESASGANNKLPAIAIDRADNLMVAWSAGEGLLPYATWPAAGSPPTEPTGCILTAGEVGEIVETQLSGGSADLFALAYSAAEPGQVGQIYALNFDGGNWIPLPESFGHGFSPDVMVDLEDQIHVAWCSEDLATQYHRNNEETEQIDSPICNGRPILGQDSNGQPHLVWYSEAVTNINGATLPASIVYESILTSDGWSIPAIAAQTTLPTQPELATQFGDSLHLVWSDNSNGSDSIHYAQQEVFNCSEDSLSDLGLVTLTAMQTADFHPTGYQVPFCENQFQSFIHQPNPEPGFSDEPPAPNGGFDRVAELAATAQYEVLFTVMQWDADENDLNPGSTMARGVAELYQKVKDNPEQYPKGILVRILLGNYPTFSTLHWGDQIWNVLDDLRDEGVAEMDNPEIGWKVEVANYDGTYPHSHTKFMVVDGKTLMGSGFNYGWLHYSREHPSGKGDNLVDLAMVIDGPVAQAAISAFDDMWIGAIQMHCSDFFPDGETSWTETCSASIATGGHSAEVMKYYLADEQNHAFSLYRTTNYQEADAAYSAVLNSAKSSIDAIHVNFSLELICWLNMIAEDYCTFDDALPWMNAMMNAVEQNQVKVRVIVENSNSNGIENRIGIDVLEKELINRGLEDLVEVRFFNGRLHSKSALIDQEFLVVGSQNFHYSSWGEGGLLEYGVATDDPHAASKYLDMFEYYWEQAIPPEEADWASTG